MSTAVIIRSALHRRYGKGDATAIAFEVAAGTGRHANRHIDAVVMELWPSRGLSLHAIEIKVSKSDFKRELENGAKAEEIAQHCDFMSIAAPLGLIKTTELPSAWGLIEMKKDEILQVTKTPVKTKAHSLTRDFMAAMVRKIARAPDLTDNAKILSERLNSLETTFSERVNEAAKRYSAAGVKWTEFVAAVGDVNYKDEEILNSIRLIVRSGTDSVYGGARELEKRLREAAERIKEAADTMNLRELPKGNGKKLW